VDQNPGALVVASKIDKQLSCDAKKGAATAAGPGFRQAFLPLMAAIGAAMMAA